MLVAPPGAKPGKYPTLGFDPAPGESAMVDSTSTKIAKVAGDLDSMREALGKIGVVDGIWQGQAAQAFVRVVEPLPKQADEIAQALYKASGLLTDWEGSLADYRRRAVELEDQATAAKAELEQARNDPALDLAGQHFPDDESLRQAQARLDAAVRDVRMWEDRLQEIIDQARRLLGTHQDEANRIAEQINKIIEDTRGLLEKFGDAIGDAFEAIGDAVEAGLETAWQIIQDNANLIAALSDVVADLSTIIGLVGDVLGFFPTPVTLGLDVALNGIAFGMQAVALGGHLLAREAGADVHDFTIAMDVYGLASGAVGFAPGPAGFFMDAAGLGFQGGVEIGSGGEVPTFWGDLGDYWVPDSAGEAVLGAASPAGLAFWNAIQQGHQKDLEARGES